MNPVAFTVFGLEVRWYGVLIAIAMALGAYLAIHEARKHADIGEDNLMDFLLWMIPFSIIGARLYYVAFQWDYYGQHLSEIIRLRQGGLAIHGGILFAIIVAIVFTKRRHLSFWKMADIVTPSLALGQAIGRWGNFANGEAHGGPTDLPWAITVNGVKVHPTFLYESLWDFALFLFLYFYMKRHQKFNGQLFSLYLIVYSVGRFWIEGLRTDSLMLGPLRIAQVVSIAMVVCGGIIYVIGKKNTKKESL